MKELKEYLKERMEELKDIKKICIERMYEKYTEDGFYRERYFETLAKIGELEEVLEKIEEVEVNEEVK